MRSTNILETSKAKDIVCTWSVCLRTDTMAITDSSGRILDRSSVPFLTCSWCFNWDKLKINELTGYIIVEEKQNYFRPKKFEVTITEKSREFAVDIVARSNKLDVSYKFSLTPHFAPPLIPQYVTKPEEPSYDEMFLPSEQNDRVLVVEGKKLHVSKAFLSYHSEYFRALFSSNYKESQMDEIPIKDVSFQDFALLLSSFYPNPVFPNDAIVHKLLEMSRRFMVLSVINIIEYHLLNNSRIDDKKMLWLADEYGMPKLLETCICGLTVEKVKSLSKSVEYEKLSDSTKVKILDRLVKMI